MFHQVVKRYKEKRLSHSHKVARTRNTIGKVKLLTELRRMRDHFKWGSEGIKKSQRESDINLEGQQKRR